MIDNRNVELTSSPDVLNEISLTITGDNIFTKMDDFLVTRDLKIVKHTHEYREYKLNLVDKYLAAFKTHTAKKWQGHFALVGKDFIKLERIESNTIRLTFKGIVDTRELNIKTNLKGDIREAEELFKKIFTYEYSTKNRKISILTGIFQALREWNLLEHTKINKLVFFISRGGDKNTQSILVSYLTGKSTNDCQSKVSERTIPNNLNSHYYSLETLPQEKCIIPLYNSGKRTNYTEDWTYMNSTKVHEVTYSGKKTTVFQKIDSANLLSKQKIAIMLNLNDLNVPLTDAIREIMEDVKKVSTSFSPDAINNADTYLKQEQIQASLEYYFGSR